MRSFKSRSMAAILALCIAFGSAAALVGCGEDPATPLPPPASSEDDPEAEPSASYVGMDLDCRATVTADRPSSDVDGGIQTQETDWGCSGTFDYANDQADFFAGAGGDIDVYYTMYWRQGTYLGALTEDEKELPVDPFAEPSGGKKLLAAVAESAKDGQTRDDPVLGEDPVAKCVRTVSTYDVVFRLLSNILLTYETDYTETEGGYEKVVPVTGEHGLVKQLTETAVKILELADFETTTLADFFGFLPVKQVINDFFKGISAEEALPIATLAYGPFRGFPKPEAGESVYTYLTEKMLASPVKTPFPPLDEDMPLSSYLLKDLITGIQGDLTKETTIDAVEDYGANFDTYLTSFLFQLTRYPGEKSERFTDVNADEATVVFTFKFDKDKNILSADGTVAFDATWKDSEYAPSETMSGNIEGSLSFLLQYETPSPVVDLSGAWYYVGATHLHLNDGVYTADLQTLIDDPSFFETFADRKIVATVSGGNTIELEFFDGEDKSLGTVSFCYDGDDVFYTLSPNGEEDPSFKTRSEIDADTYCRISFYHDKQIRYFLSADEPMVAFDIDFNDIGEIFPAYISSFQMP